MEDSARLRFDFLRRAFAGYYGTHASEIPPPSEMEKREFGFLMFRERFMIRHRGFRLPEELRDSIVSLVPSDTHYSAAYYERPTVDMDRKGWLGSDLVFDVDADHLDTACRKTHDVWTCNTCKRVSRGAAPKVCPDCKGTKIEDRPWMCDECLNAARLEVLKLLDFLSTDFGIEDRQMAIFFSGHRGYHLHVKSPSTRTLSDEQRKEIVDYVLGIGLDIEWQGLLEEFARGTRIIHGPNASTPGWPGRLTATVRDALTHASVEDLVQLGFRRNVAKTIVSARDAESDVAFADRLWMPARGVSLETWRHVIPNILTKYPITARIDTVVTTDIHRLIRLPNTLNGKTGFKACHVPIEKLKEFDPFDSPIVFQGETEVHIIESPELRIKDRRLGPYSNEKVTVPTAAAILLVAKGMAVPVGT
jgi:DNA primase small subunit